MKFFEVKIKYEKVFDDGKSKMVTETYALDAMTFTEAEARITKEMQPFITGEFFITAEKIAQYNEVVFNGGDLFFLVKYNFINIDGITGKEKRTPMFVLFQEEDIDKAKQHARDHMKGSLMDYEIVVIKETKIVNVFTLDTDLDLAMAENEIE